MPPLGETAFSNRNPLIAFLQLVQKLDFKKLSLNMYQELARPCSECSCKQVHERNIVRDLRWIRLLFSRIYYARCHQLKMDSTWKIFTRSVPKYAPNNLFWSSLLAKIQRGCSEKRFMVVSKIILKFEPTESGTLQSPKLILLALARVFFNMTSWQVIKTSIA